VTPWVDVHAHFSPPAGEAELVARWEGMRAAQFLVPEPFRWSAEATLAHMDRAGTTMQLLSNIPKTVDALRASNDFGASLVAAHPDRFGLLAALPTDDPDAALAEIARTDGELPADGFAVTCRYHGVYLGDPLLDPVWTELDRRHATVFAHPDAYAPAGQGRPAPLLEVGFETVRTVVDLLYAGWFRRFPNVTLVVAHCGGAGALPAMSGRLLGLGTEVWVPNPNGLTRDELREQLASLYLDTAATGFAPSLAAALTMIAPDHLVYGSDCGVPCSTEATMAASKDALLAFDGLTADQRHAVGRNALPLFPTAAARLTPAVSAAQR
jgi:6-methylsalicylate decarboxylase